MKHVPHLVVTAPWEGSRLDLSSHQWRHVTKVLRMQGGEDVTYTNGLGIIGSGVLTNQGIERGEEVDVERPTNLTMAVAPPASKDRQRFLVEKLTELGVARLVWLETKHGKDRLASASKVFGWIHGALEQSRGAYLMETSDELLGLGDLEGRVVVCMPGGDTAPDDFDVIAIGPEGGFAEDELPENARLWDLGPTVLRVETAAIVAAARQTSF
jgi:16S rRNA (uracil1498-N3)-methyltransferase